MCPMLYSNEASENSSDDSTSDSSTVSVTIVAVVLLALFHFLQAVQDLGNSKFFPSGVLRVFQYDGSVVKIGVQVGAVFERQETSTIVAPEGGVVVLPEVLVVPRGFVVGIFVVDAM